MLKEPAAGRVRSSKLRGFIAALPATYPKKACRRHNGWPLVGTEQPDVGRVISIAHPEPAVDVDRLTCHVVGIAAGEKAHDASHVVGSFGPAEGDKRGSPLPGFTGLPALDFAPLRVDLLPHRRVDRPGPDAIRPNPFGRQHLRGGARDADDAGLAGRIV